MIVELPASRPYGGLFLVGDRRQGGGVQRIGSIVAKASYVLEEQSSTPDVYAMRADPDAARSRPLLADGLAGGDVAHEGDAATWKPQTDIVVEGFPVATDDTQTLELSVAGRPWIRRQTPTGSQGPGDLPDRNRHLFGYHPRTVAPRVGQAGRAFDPALIPSSRPVPWEPIIDEPAGLADLDGYQDAYANFHRRGGSGFAVRAHAGGAFASGERVAVARITRDDEGREVRTELFALVLSFAPLFALYRTYCGHGPDRPPHWSRRRLGVMRPDTLILIAPPGSSPTQPMKLERAVILWRAVWPWADEPIDSYRAVRVSEEEI